MSGIVVLFMNSSAARVEVEDQNAAVSVKQLTGPRMARMTFEARVVHPRHGRMRLQKPRNCEGALILMPDSECQRLEAPVEQKRSVRVHRTAQVIQLVRDLLNQHSRPRNSATNDIRVAVQILRRAVYRQIESGLYGPEIDRSGKGAIDDRNEPMPARELNHSAQVRDREQRIGHGFDIDSLRIRA